MRFSVPKYWREKESHYRLKATRCKSCGRINYPPSKICRYCGSEDTEEIYLDKEPARLVTWTIIHTVPEGFDEQKPRIIGIVELEQSHVRILAPITDVKPEELRENMILEPVLRRINEDGEAGLIYYGIAYRPVIPPVERKQ
jgi:uncharacterized OB-fold protein